MSLRFNVMMDQHDALQLNALQLAYLGDSVWELIVRYEQVLLRYNVNHMHKNCVGSVNAHSQAAILRSVQELLNETESEIVKRGRNAHARHTVPRNQNPDEYAAATGFEALLGFLYLTGQNERISMLVNHIREAGQNG